MLCCVELCCIVLCVTVVMSESKVFKYFCSSYTLKCCSFCHVITNIRRKTMDIDRDPAHVSLGKTLHKRFFCDLESERGVHINQSCDAC